MGGVITLGSVLFGSLLMLLPMNPLYCLSTLIGQSVVVPLCSALLVIVTSSAVFAEALPFKDGDRVLFLGDSITQDGRYAALVEAYFWSAHADKKIEFINVGLSSETVSGITEPVHPYPRPNIHHRLDRALKISRPDWVLICYGMNDGIYHPSEARITDAYREGLTTLVDRVAQVGAKAIVITPPTFDYDAPAIQSRQQSVKADEPYGYKKPFPQYNDSLAALAKIVFELKKHPAVERVIGIHQPMSDYVAAAKAAQAGYEYGDGVHPPQDGHLMMARSILAGLGCDDAQAVLRQLTGIHAVTDPDHTAPTATQQRFTSLLFDRFGKRATVYRQATLGAVDQPIDRRSLTAADEAAAAAQAKLADLVMELTDGESLLKLYRVEANKKWDPEIQKLLQRDQEQTAPDDAVLFIGSSSIRLWDSIANDMAPYKPIQRGYGGATYRDLAVFAKQLCTPHRYKACVVFVANDLTGKADDTPLTHVKQLAQHICRVSLQHQPEAPVFLIEVTPTPSRFPSWDKIQQVNDSLRSIALTTPKINFVITAEHYLDTQKQPIAAYFRDDKLHQNQSGYTLWSRLIKDALDTGLAVQP